jgi:hypothetical protein
MAKKASTRKTKPKVAPEQKPLEGMETVRNLPLDEAISERVKALSRAKKATEEAASWLDKIGGLMIEAKTYKYSYENYTATLEEGKALVKVKKDPKKTKAK